MHSAPRLHATATSAPQALPALVAGIVAVLLGLFVGALFALLSGIGAITLAGMAWADIRAHSFGGQHLAIIGAILGVLAIVLSVVAWVAL
jgi:hypothetical protein